MKGVLSKKDDPQAKAKKNQWTGQFHYLIQELKLQPFMNPTTSFALVRQGDEIWEVYVL